MWSSQPISPTKLTRRALTLWPATVIIWLVLKGKLSLSSGLGVSWERMSLL